MNEAREFKDDVVVIVPIRRRDGGGFEVLLRGSGAWRAAALTRVITGHVNTDEDPEAAACRTLMDAAGLEPAHWRELAPAAVRIFAAHGLAESRDAGPDADTSLAVLAVNGLKDVEDLI